MTLIWDLEQLKLPPKVEIVSETTDSGITVTELFYTSPGSGDRELRIFAYYARPTGVENLPALVWVHGGACVGQRDEAVKWAKRDYAAISMDLPGKGGPYRVTSRSEGPDMTDPAIFNVYPNPKHSYLYLCVNAACRAISFLQSREEVDPNRIGMLGISWGGVITLLANGIDDRITAACTVFGAGYITDESYWISTQLAEMNDEEKEIWRRYFDPSSYLNTQHGRTLFVTATEDVYFPLRSFMRTYEGAKCEKAIYLVPDKNHEIDGKAVKVIEEWFDASLKPSEES